LVNSKYSIKRCGSGLAVAVEEEFCHGVQRRQSSSSVFSTPHARKLPNAFTDHNAPPSVIKLFTKWVEQADTTDNGIIVINLQKQTYSNTTTTKAIRWLKAHRLLMMVEQGGGRGVASRYFVRWSFDHETLSARQNAVNSSEYKNTANPFTIEENHEDLLAMRKRNASLAPNKPSPKALAWAMSQVRTAVNRDFRVNRARQKQILSGMGAAIWRAMVRGKLKAGPKLAAFIHDLIRRLLEVRRRFGARAWCTYGGWLVHTTLTAIRAEEAQRAQQRREEIERKREREEVRKDPFTELLREEGQEHMTDYIRAIVSKEPRSFPDRESRHRTRHINRKVRSGPRVNSHGKV